MDKKAGKRHSGIFNELQSPGFKPWMRTIAAVVLFCFCYQDAISAIGGDYERTLKTMFQPSTNVPAIQHPTGLMAGISSFFISNAYAQDRSVGPSSFDGGDSGNNNNSSNYTPPPTPPPPPTPTPPTPTSGPSWTPARNTDGWTEAQPGCSSATRGR